MPNLGMGELLVIFVVGLLVFGPNRLPEIARNLGKAWRVFQDETRKAREVFRDVLDDETVKTVRGAVDVGAIDRVDEPGPGDGARAPEATPAAGAPAAAVPAVPIGPPPDIPASVREHEGT